jgi:ribose transport system substrate-binding protein
MGETKRRKVVMLIAPFIAITSLIAGCGSSNGSATAPSTSSSATSASSGSAPTGLTSASASAAMPSGSASTVTYDGPNAGLPAELPASDHKAITVGYLQAYTGVSTLVATQNAIQQTVEKLGGKFILKDANLNPQTQVSQMNELISQRVDAITVFPIDPVALTPSLAKAKAAGIPIIAVSATLGGNEPVPEGYVATVDLPADRAAFETVQRVAENHPQAGIVILGSTLPVPAINYPVERATYWARRFGLNILGQVDTTQDNPSGYAAAANTVAARYPKANVVLAYNDAFAIPVAQILASSGHRNILVTANNGGARVGFDAVAAGKLYSVYSIPWDQVGVQAAYAAYAANAGTKVPPVILPLGQLITADNAKTAKAAGE